MNQHYSEAGFWQKIGQLPRRAGGNVLEKAMLLYVLLKDESVPALAKAAILGALGYFIWPLDLVPDVLPAGYTDDLAAMAALLMRLHEYVTPETRRLAKERMP